MRPRCQVPSPTGHRRHPSTASAGDRRPGPDTEHLRADRLPDIDMGMADQNAESAVPCRREIGDGRRQVVDPVQGLDHHPLDPQIMTPDLLDQHRIMDPST